MTRQDMIDATEWYLLQRLPQAAVDDIPLESLPAQVHRAAIAWVLNGGTRPPELSQTRSRPRPARRGTRALRLDPYLTDVIGARALPPGVGR